MSSNFVNLALVNTSPDVLYEIQSVTDPVAGTWVSEGFVHGSELTNWTPMNVPQNNRPGLFMRIRSWADSTGTDIPDWWWLEYFGQTTNVNAYAADPAGDGYDDLQKFQLGIAPGTFYNTNAPGGFFGCLDTSQTNVFLEWSPSPGPVVNYLVQRGVLNTNTGNYVYSQIGTVSSNAVFFEDVGAISNANAWNNIYNLEALYPAGLVTATDTWYASYGEYSYTGAPYGAPVPRNVYAYAPANGTNVLLSWTAATPGATPTNYIIERGILNTNTGNYAYSQIAAVNTNTTYIQDVHAITNANAWNDVYEVMAVFPGGVLSQPSTASISTNLPQPTGISASVDSTGTNVVITWTPPQGIAVSNYIIERGIFNTNTDTYSYSQIGNVNSNTTSFEDAGAITGNNSYNNAYEVEAEFPGGGVSGFDETSLPGPPAGPLYNLYAAANLIRNGAGRWQVVFSGLPSNAVDTIQFTWTDVSGNPLSSETISTTNVIDDVYPLGDTDAVNNNGNFLLVQLIGSNGEAGPMAQAGYLATDAPYFVDGRRHMKQNLNFLIRGASVGHVFFYSDQNEWPTFDDPFQGQYNQVATNFEEFSFLHHGAWNNGAWESLGYNQLDSLWPFTANYELSNYFVDTTATNLDYLDFFYGSPLSFTFTPNFSTNIPAPAILTHADPYWIYQPSFDPYTYSYPNDFNWDMTLDDFTNYTPYLVGLESGGQNLFGQLFETGCVASAAQFSGAATYQSLVPGNSIAIPPNNNGILYASWCPAPSLLLVNYYFAPLTLANPALGVYTYDIPGILPGELNSYTLRPQSRRSNISAASRR